jgi:hypothetical protein
MKLKKSVKAKWVKALRSGEYQQGTGALHGEDYASGTDVFCCLGVACDIGITRPCENGDEFADYAFLPEETQQKLAGYNDGSPSKKKPRRSFKWIAAYIERYL